MEDYKKCQMEFTSHVLKACFTKGRSPAFFLAGFVEETAELVEAIEDKGQDEWRQNVISELGDLLWYTHAIIEHLPGGKMHPEEQDESIRLELKICPENQSQLPIQPLLLIGKVAGAVKKHLRGDKDWPTMRCRIQAAINGAVSSLVALTASCLDSNFYEVLKEAMNSNKIKIEARLRLNTIRGDGARETVKI